MASMSTKIDDCNRLVRAAFQGDSGVVCDLLAKGTNVDCRSSLSPRRTALESALYGGHESIVYLLIDRGADVNARSEGGLTPLHIAVDLECEDALAREDSGEKDVVPICQMTTILVEAGADPSLADASGETPLDWAIERNHDRAVAMMREKTP